MSQTSDAHLRFPWIMKNYAIHLHFSSVDPTDKIIGENNRNVASADGIREDGAEGKRSSSSNVLQSLHNRRWRRTIRVCQRR